MAAAGWLAAKSRSYWEDAARLEREGGNIEGLTGKQWGIVYRAISAELNKCAENEDALRYGVEALIQDLEHDRWLAAHMNNLYDTRFRVSRALVARLRELLDGAAA